MIADGSFSPSEPSLFKSIINSLLQDDHYMLLADLLLYLQCQERVSMNYMDKEEWSKKFIINVTNVGKFSSGRAIDEYARDI